MEQDWESRIAQAKEKADILERLLNALTTELKSFEGSESDRCYKELQIHDTWVNLKSVNYFIKKMKQDKVNNDKLGEAKAKYAQENSVAILKKAGNQFMKKRPNFPEIERLRVTAINAEQGSKEWVDAIFNLGQQLK